MGRNHVPHVAHFNLLVRARARVLILPALMLISRVPHATGCKLGDGTWVVPIRFAGFGALTCAASLELHVVKEDIASRSA